MDSVQPAPPGGRRSGPWTRRGRYGAPGPTWSRCRSGCVGHVARADDSAGFTRPQTRRCDRGAATLNHNPDHSAQGVVGGPPLWPHSAIARVMTAHIGTQPRWKWRQLEPSRSPNRTPRSPRLGRPRIVRDQLDDHLPHRTRSRSRVVDVPVPGRARAGHARADRIGSWKVARREPVGGTGHRGLDTLLARQQPVRGAAQRPAGLRIGAMGQLD